jgi:hypothetical protein
MIEAFELDRPIQLSPKESRDLALNLLSASEAAEQDGFMVEFFRNELKQPDEVLGHVLREFRECRKKWDTT